MNKQIKVPETRGGKTKYNFNDFKIGETLTFENTTTGIVISCAKSYCKQRGLNWSFRCYSMNGFINIVRIK